MSVSPSESAAGNSPAPFAKVAVVTKFQKKKKKKKTSKRQASEDTPPVKNAKRDSNADFVFRHVRDRVRQTHMHELMEFLFVVDSSTPLVCLKTTCLRRSLRPLGHCLIAGRLERQPRLRKNAVFQVREDEDAHDSDTYNESFADDDIILTQRKRKYQNYDDDDYGKVETLPKVVQTRQDTLPARKAQDTRCFRGHAVRVFIALFLPVSTCRRRLSSHKKLESHGLIRLR